MKILTRNKDIENEAIKILLSKHDKSPETKILDWEVFENKIIINNAEDSIALLYTIKWIDDLIYWDISDKEENIKFLISENVDSLKDDYKDVEHIRIYNNSISNFEKEISFLSFFNKLNSNSDYIDIEILFNKRLEYTETVDLDTKRGVAKFKVARTLDNEYLYSIFWKGELKNVVNLRIHYQCETSEIFGSNHCDCREQLDGFLDNVFIRGNDIMIYAHEEGRGLGLFNKNNAYFETQENNLDTFDAMVKVAGKAEGRNFEIPADIINHMGIKEVNIWTNNPRKFIPLEARGIKVNRMESWYKCDGEKANKYMNDKRLKLDHLD